MPEDKKSGAEGEKRVREPMYFLRILICIYLLYLSYQIISDLAEKNFQDKASLLLLAFAVFLALCGIFFIILSVRSIVIKGKKEAAEYARIKAEEALSEASSSCDDGESSADDGEAGESSSDISSESDE